MKKKHNHLKIIIGILFLITLIMFSILIGTHSYSNDSLIPILLMIFYGFILGVLFSIYSSFKKPFILWVVIIIFLFLIVTIGKAMYMENRVKKAYIGMSKNEFEEIFGNGESSSSSPACEKCKEGYTQYYYRLDSNLWYSHLEDSYTICYDYKNIICDKHRIGL